MVGSVFHGIKSTDHFSRETYKSFCHDAVMAFSIFTFSCCIGLGLFCDTHSVRKPNKNAGMLDPEIGVSRIPSK
jgi:hypothetical protein